MSAEINLVKEYYDIHVIGKLRGYVYGNERVERAYSEILSWIKQKPLNIIEIGCGVGDIIYRMAQKYPKANCIGFDVSPKSIEIAKSIFGKENLRFILADDISLVESVNQKFDLIFLIDVFEHIPVGLRENIFKFIKNTISETGIVFMSCPTIAHQNYLRKNNPNGLQPIDEDISIEDFLTFSKNTSLPILKFKEVSVWNAGDYSHVVFGKRNYAPYSDKPSLRQKGIKTLIYEKIFKREGKLKEIELKEKLNLLKSTLDPEIYKAIIS